jgi:PadR family transcriptional regulator, regulatory protein AphA
VTDFEQVLLGMIFGQPATGYDLKRRFATTALGVYQPSSGALYPALDRLERRGLLASQPPSPAATGRPRRLYRLTEAGRQAHLGWLREPVAAATVAQDLGLHLLRFAMMATVLAPAEVVEFLETLRSALAGFVASLEQQVAALEQAGNPYPALAVEHGLAVHRASLTWADQAITRVAAASGAGAEPA